MRAEESTARAKLPEFACNKRASSRTRHVDTWHPILDWLETAVWERIHQTGVPYHRAYDLGMPRLSCVFCIFAPREALIIAGKANPELLADYVAVEERINHRFTEALSIKSVARAIEQGETVSPGTKLTGTWNM